jgi:predicted amidophosphoribosyltransferase
MATSPCPACPRNRTTGRYLCPVCWYRLPTDTRQALSRRGPSALRRHRSLLDQITAGTPLHAIRIE